jgi:hypothetical protein
MAGRGQVNSASVVALAFIVNKNAMIKNTLFIQDPFAFILHLSKQ